MEYNNRIDIRGYDNKVKYYLKALFRWPKEAEPFQALLCIYVHSIKYIIPMNNITP